MLIAWFQGALGVLSPSGQVLFQDIISLLWEADANPVRRSSLPSSTYRIHSEPSQSQGRSTFTIGVDCIAGCGPHSYSLAFDSSLDFDAFTSWFDEGLDLHDAHQEKKRSSLTAVLESCS